MPRRSGAVAAVVLGLLVPAPAANASGADVVYDCVHNGRLTRTYTQKEYRQALAHLPTDVAEYTDCQSVIRRAELGLGGGGKGGTPTPGSVQNPFAGATPQEVAQAQKDIAAARKGGGVKQRIGGALVTPGALAFHQIRSVSKLPAPLLALVVLIVLGAVGLAVNILLRRRERPGTPGA